jgi:hypothetical protein
VEAPGCGSHPGGPGSSGNSVNWQASAAAAQRGIALPKPPAEKRVVFSLPDIFFFEDEGKHVKK